MSVKYTLARMQTLRRMCDFYLNIYDVQQMFDDGLVGREERDAEVSNLTSQFDQARQEYDAVICAEIMEA